MKKTLVLETIATREHLSAEVEAALSVCDLELEGNILSLTTVNGQCSKYEIKGSKDGNYYFDMKDTKVKLYISDRIVNLCLLDMTPRIEYHYKVIETKS